MIVVLNPASPLGRGVTEGDGEGIDNMLFTVYVFEDTETGEIREIEQFT